MPGRAIADISCPSRAKSKTSRLEAGFFRFVDIVICRDLLLDDPAQHNLGVGATVAIGDLANDRNTDDGPAGQGAERRRRDAQGLPGCAQVGLIEQRMKLDLMHGDRRTAHLACGCQHRPGEIADADGVRENVVICPDQRFDNRFDGAIQGLSVQQQ